MINKQQRIAANSVKIWFSLSCSNSYISYTTYVSRKSD